MCGRYTLATPLEELVEEFGFGGPLPGLRPSYNVAPTQEVATVVENDGGRRLEMSRWGLIPAWADDPGIGRV
jgi:putative SOS response-associated peptidase YedK